MSGYHEPTHPNKATAEGVNSQRGGFNLARPWKAYHYRSGWVVADMTAPASFRECIIPGTFDAVEFLVIPPAGVTQFSVIEGRWIVVDKPVDETIWVETEQHTCNGPTIIRVLAETDPVAVYITGIQGDATGGLKMAYREAPWR